MYDVLLTYMSVRHTNECLDIILSCFMCMYILSTCMSVHHTYVCVLGNVLVRFLSTGHKLRYLRGGDLD